MASVAEREFLPASRRRRLSRRRVGQVAAPYVLLAPAAAVVGVVLAYPLYLLAKMSFQKYGVFELIRHKGHWLGTANYASIFHDAEFWRVVLRTVAFTAVCVSLTMVLGTAIALLLLQVSRIVRVALTTGLVLVWAIPTIVAVNLWHWMVDYEFGVANWTLTKLHLGNFIRHDWFANPWTGFGVFTALIVWGAIPFVTITVYAGLAQVPRELVEAAEIDGASSLRVFRDVTFPVLKPIFLILTSLSIIWDFGVFTQPYLLIGKEHLDSSNYVMGVYVFIEGYLKNEYGRGAAISLLMLLMVAVMSVFYVRRMVKMGDAR